MKTRKKVLIALLTVSCMAAGAVGLAACDDGEVRDPALSGLYNSYVEQNGDSAKSYEDWLKDVFNSLSTPGSNGQQGPKGEDGEDGKDGAPGANGLSAYEIYSNAVSADGGVPLTEAEWLASLVGADGNPGADGNGIQSVAMTSDGKGLLITYDDGSTTTVTLPAGMTHVHNYDYNSFVTVLPSQGGNAGLGYVTCTSSDCNHMELILVREAEGDGGEWNPFVLGEGLAMGESATYSLTISGEDLSFMNWGYVWESYFTFPLADDGEMNQYVVTINSEFVTYNYNFEPVYQFNVLTDSEDSMDDYYEFDVEAPEEAEEAGTFTFSVTVTRVEAPEEGSVYNPIAIEAGEKVTYKAEPGAEVYFSFKSGSDSVGYKHDFNVNNVSLTWLGMDVYNDNAGELTNDDVKKMGYTYVYYYKASAVDGNIEFTLNEYHEPGEMQNPIKVTVGDSEATSPDKMGIWYSFTVEEDGVYTIEGDGLNLDLYESNTSTGNGSKYIETKTLVKLTAGTYYICSKGACSFNVRAYDAEEDGAGTSPIVPMALTGGSKTLESTASTYFVYTVEEDGWFSLCGDNAMYSVYTDESFSGTPVFSQKSNDLFVAVKAGDKIYVSARATYINDAYKSGSIVFGVATDESAAIDHTLVLVDKNGEALPEGVTVKAVIEETVSGKVVNTTVVATGKTDKDGKAVLNMVPGKYTVKVEFGDVEGYSYPMSGTDTIIKKCFVETETTVTVDVKETYTVKVLSAGEAVEGVKVVLEEYFSKEKFEATTDSNGVATFFVADSTSYTVTIGGDDYTTSDRVTLYNTNRDGEISVTQKVEYTTINSSEFNDYTITKDGITGATAYTFTLPNGDDDFQFTVTNGHFEYFAKDTGRSVEVYVEDGAPAQYGLIYGYNNYDITFYGNATVQVIIVPDGDEPATFTITQIPYEV